MSLLRMMSSVFSTSSTCLFVLSLFTVTFLISETTIFFDQRAATSMLKNEDMVTLVLSMMIFR